MRTLRRTVIILLAALVVAVGLLALGQGAAQGRQGGSHHLGFQGAWADGVAKAVITANQAQMTAAYNANVAAGSAPATSGAFFATAGNLARMLVVAAAVVAGSVLLDKRRRVRR